MQFDPVSVDKVVEQIENERTQMILLYGSIPRTNGTMLLFDDVQQQLLHRVNGDRNKKTTIWFYNTNAVERKSNGTRNSKMALDRISCLFQRAREWTKQHSPSGGRLVVV